MVRQQIEVELNHPDIGVGPDPRAPPLERGLYLSLLTPPVFSPAAPRLSLKFAWVVAVGPGVGVLRGPGVESADEAEGCDAKLNIDGCALVLSGVKHQRLRRTTTWGRERI